ncbi:MAG: hypothetical protein HS132_10075 [Planctomycetia bacterium]|nr:hypothetical protein [Planctomycetia bacterium]
MKRPKIKNSNKGILFGLPSMLLLVFVFTLSMVSNAIAASGSFDRESYVPSFGDSNDFDRAWISVVDSTANTSSGLDTITVTVKQVQMHRLSC